MVRLTARQPKPNEVKLTVDLETELGISDENQKVRAVMNCVIRGHESADPILTATVECRFHNGEPDDEKRDHVFSILHRRLTAVVATITDMVAANRGPLILAPFDHSLVKEKETAQQRGPTRS